MENNTKKYLTVGEMIHVCLSNWLWFVVSVALCVTLSVVYVKTTAPMYKRSMRVLLMNSSNNRTYVGDLKTMNFRPLYDNLYNEIEMLRSTVLMEKVVENLNLEVEYTYPGIFYQKVLYGIESPVKVEFADESINDKGFKIDVLDSVNLVLSEFVGVSDAPESMPAVLNKPIQTPCGIITVTPTCTYNPKGKFKKVVCVKKMQVASASLQFLSELDVTNDALNKSTMVNVSITDHSTSRADAILNELMRVYDENWWETQNRSLENTAAFLEERVSELGEELGQVDDHIASYKGNNLIPNVDATQNIYLNQNNNTRDQIQKLNYQLSLLQYLRKYLSDNIGQNRPLPVNIGIEDQGVSGLLNSYNTLQLQRNEIVAYAGDAHPRVKELENQLDILRSNIMESIDQTSLVFTEKIKGLNKMAGSSAQKIVSSTMQETHLKSSEREQNVKESLYLLLMQEREKANISLNHSTSNIRIIQTAGGSMEPVSPLKVRIILMAFLIGLGLPFVIIFIYEVSYNKVRSRKDMEFLQMPFLGEIPQKVSVSKFRRFLGLYKKYKPRNKYGISVVVKHGERDAINESFRVVRTNLEFMLRKDSQRKVVMITSANPGSGKSFISINLAAVVAVLGKKVLVMDLDLRHASLSKKMKNHQSKGISSYLAGYSDDFDDILVRDAIFEGVDVIPVGELPPNPAELLHDERMVKLMTKMRENYDLIILDTPPIDIVTDTDIINQYSDIAIFVIRAGVMDKVWLPELERMYSDNHINNLCAILNGTDMGHYANYHKYGGYYGQYGGYYQNIKAAK